MAIWSQSSQTNFSQQRFAGPRRTLYSLAGLLLCGCVTAPPDKHSKLMVETPAQWAVENASAQSSTVDLENWISDFQDPVLEKIVNEALEANLDLKVASARLDAALASSRAARSELLPSVSLSGSGRKDRRNSASGIQQTPTSESYGLSGRVSWEIDLWGKVRNGARGDLADAQAAVADFDAARLSIAARTAKAWYAAVEANQQYELEVRILDALSESSRIVEENFSSGIARALDVRLVRANLASSKSSLEQRRRSRDAAVRSLETLLGRYPKSEMEVASQLPQLGESPAAGLPSELLLRRPDIRAAERRLAAAEQRAFEESKARLPSIDLALSRGTSANEVWDIFDFVERRIWSQSLSVAQTLFQGRRLKANYERAKAVYEQSVASYSQVVLTAFREVEDELANQSSYEINYGLLEVAAEESIEAERLAWDEYASGLTDITTVLDSVRRSISAQRAFIQVANQRIQSRIDLYLALGGGFES